MFTGRRPWIARALQRNNMANVGEQQTHRSCISLIDSRDTPFQCGGCGCGSSMDMNNSVRVATVPHGRAERGITNVSETPRAHV